MSANANRWSVAAAAFIFAAGLLFWGIRTSGTEKPDEETAAGVLDSPYEDWRQQEIPFGYSSAYLAPWRAYMDTWDTRRYFETLGINFNVSAKEADATAQLLAEAGFTSARVEIGWGNVDYDDESRLRTAPGDNFDALLKALKKHGIRPLILLNANSGYPVPLKQWDVRLKKSARAGSRVVYVNQTEGIVPDYTGLTGLAYQTMFPVITKADAKTGRLELSAPLPKDVTAGTLQLVKLKYRPFSGTVYQDGKANPAALETIEGWKKYVKTVADAVKKSLGTGYGARDAGFDLEVWNEMTFGSQFLDIQNYYDPPLRFSGYPAYSLGGRTQTGSELLLPLTVDYVNDPAHRLPGVRVISGFSNQRPWENGTELFAGQTGFSRHYYTGYTESDSLVRYDPLAAQKPRLLSAAGTEEPAEAPFVPEHVNAMPEKWFYGYKTEFVVRDLQPFPGPFSQHFRYANPGNGHQAEVWMTETNWWRWPFAQRLMREARVSEKDVSLRRLMLEIGAKATLRLFTFYSHKGVQTVDIYAAKAGDVSYGVIADAFFDELAANGYRLTDSARQAAGPQIRALTRLAKLLRPGEEIENPRPLRVDRVKERNERVVLAGDGTAEHPDVHAAADLAILPFQLNSRSFAIGYYVATRDMTQAWQSDKGPLDPRRYALPPEKFEITLDNVAGDRASVYAYDPFTDSRFSVTVTERTDHSLTAELESVDYPRFLMLEENFSSSAPRLSGTRLERMGADTYFTFTPNAEGTAEITWGAYPARKASAFQEDYYLERSDSSPASSRNIDLLNQLSLPSVSGVWRWTATIVPAYSETYTFVIQSDGCEVALQINGLNVINGCGNPVTEGGLRLAAGEPYQLELIYIARKASPHNVTLYWASEHQPKEPVTASEQAGTGGKSVVKTRPGEPVSVPLPGFRTGDGVRAVFRSGPLETRFPLWNYDVRGVLWPSGE